jgi:hypothetical protein
MAIYIDIESPISIMLVVKVTGEAAAFYKWLKLSIKAERVSLCYPISACLSINGNI